VRSLPTRDRDRLKGTQLRQVRHRIPDWQRINRIGIEGRIALGQGSPENWIGEIQAWKELGATHLTFNTMKAGLANPAAHIDAIRRFKEVTGGAW